MELFDEQHTETPPLSSTGLRKDALQNVREGFSGRVGERPAPTKIRALLAADHQERPFDGGGPQPPAKAEQEALPQR